MNRNKNNLLKNAPSNAKEEVCVSLVGPVGCGKSEGCWTKLENLDGCELNVQLLDTYDKDRKNLEKYYKWSDALLLVYSITNRDSFQLIQEYLEQINDLMKRIADDPNEKSDKLSTKIVLLGNKIDMERYRQVTKQEVEALIEKYTNNNNNNSTSTKSGDMSSSMNSDSINLNLVHMETTSCEEYELVQNLFHKIIRDVRRERENFLITSPLQIYEETSNYVANTTAQKLNSKTKFTNHAANNSSKRAKSPKLNLNNIIQESVSKDGINAVLNQSFNGSSSSGGSPAQQQSNNALTNLSNVNSSNANSNISSIGSIKEAKKNSSKFPFFTKILNKS